jgi:hypothetical protein
LSEIAGEAGGCGVVFFEGRMLQNPQKTQFVGVENTAAIPPKNILKIFSRKARYVAADGCDPARSFPACQLQVKGE